MSQPWKNFDESKFTFQPPPTTKSKSKTLPPKIVGVKTRPVAQVVKEIISDTDRYQIPEKFKARTLNINNSKPLLKNDSYLWSTGSVKNSLSTISETSSPPMSPLKTPLTADIYSSVFFEFPDVVEKPSIYLACIDFILWEKLSYCNVYPNVSLLKQRGSSSSMTQTLKRIIRKWSRRSKSTGSDNKGEVGVLSIPGLTSSDKAVNDLGKEVKSVPLNPSLLLLSQTRNLLSSDAAWYYEYLKRVSVGLCI